MKPEEKTCCCSDKTTVRTEEEKKNLINRLSRIEGQVRGLRKMVEEDAYCIDIITQSSAVYGSINSFNKDLISKHIKTCVVRDIKAGDENTADELVKTLLMLMK